MQARNKREKFIELANKRVNNTLNEIRLVGNLSNGSNYEYTEKQVREIFSVLQDELNRSKLRFRTGESRPASAFSLSEFKEA